MVFPDGTHALDDVSLSIERGEFVTVVGPSGCGKSTLLRIASGLETHTGGECNVDRDSIGYVFQDATLFPWRTVRKNVELIAELHGVDSATMAPRVDESLELVGLKEHEVKYPRQLSGGMKMRASLARSLVLQPDVFSSTSRSVRSTRSAVSGSTTNCFRCSRPRTSRGCSSPTRLPKPYFSPPACS